MKSLTFINKIAVHLLEKDGASNTGPKVFWSYQKCSTQSCIKATNTWIQKFEMWVIRCDTHLVDFVHPVAGKFKHQFTGLYCSRHGSGVQRAGSSRKYPGYDYSWLLLCADSASLHKMASLSPSCSLIWLVSETTSRVLEERGGPGGSSLVPLWHGGWVPLRLEHLHLEEREKRWGLRSGDILDQFKSTERQKRQGGAEIVQRKWIETRSEASTHHSNNRPTQFRAGHADLGFV